MIAPKSHQTLWRHLAGVVVLLTTGLLMSCQRVEAQNGYVWKNVDIGGGGFVTGVVCHPLEQDLVYVRTDVGGAYRWDATNTSWKPLNDKFKSGLESNFYGVESLAIDPKNAAVVYMACGKYTADWGGPGAIFKSTDRGENWTKLTLSTTETVKMGSNEDKRWGGERLVVSPFNSSVVLFGSRRNGLWRSTNGGSKWAKRNVGNPVAGIGITAIVFDPGTSGRVYAAVYGDGIYRSTDNGNAWQKLNGSPQNVLRMAVGAGNLYATHNTGVSKMASGSTLWQSITPQGLNVPFCGISVNPFNTSELLVTRGETDTTDTLMWHSYDSGQTWYVQNNVYDHSANWWWFDYMKRVPWIAGLAFDPKVNGRAWLTNWYGIYRAESVWGQAPDWTTTWRPVVRGHEEVVVFSLLHLPSGSQSGPVLLSGVADVDGFNHSNGLTTFPWRTFGGVSGPSLQDTYHIANRFNASALVVRVGGNRHDNYHTVATSRDAGWNWSETTWHSNFPTLRPLRVALSANDERNFVVLTDTNQPKRTTDNGQTWQSVSGLPNGPIGPWIWTQPLAADTVQGGTFYYYDGQGKIYLSTNGGANFTVVRSDLPWDSNGILKSAPGIAGELWLATGEGGLHVSTNSGSTFTKIATVQRASLLALGKAGQGYTHPTLFVLGKVNNVDGVFRSVDRGATWLRIDVPSTALGTEPGVMEASLNEFGLVFVGTQGRGIYYGQPQ
jgi:photosystem II stability/assembly factor-like uncharacterized protein